MDARGCGHDPDAGGVLSMKVESVSVDEISPDPANARMHDRRNLDAIAGSLRRWGQQKPIVISEAGVIVAGNGTWEAAKQIGWKRINAVKTKLEGSEAVAYGIADNRTAELAGWDDAVLGKHLEALQADDSIDHLAAGFSDEELEAMLGKFAVDGIAPPELADGDRELFQQMAFVLHDSQVEKVKAAIAKAKAAGPFNGSLNENSNGNALARIVEDYLS